MGKNRQVRELSLRHQGALPIASDTAIAFGFLREEGTKSRRGSPLLQSRTCHQWRSGNRAPLTPMAVFVLLSSSDHRRVNKMEHLNSCRVTRTADGSESFGFHARRVCSIDVAAGRGGPNVYI